MGREVSTRQVAVIGGGLAGSEAAWQIARRGGGRTLVDLYEMRPVRQTPAHTTDLLAELVCSNSLKSRSPETPTGRLKEDLALNGSLIITEALKCQAPAGKALAVDRIKLGEAVTTAIIRDHAINLIREEVTEIPDGYDSVIIATGPLTSDAMAHSVKRLIGGGDSLYFYDAIAPIVEADSIDRSVAFFQDRYGPPEVGDYLNLPMSKSEYEYFIDRLLAAETMEFADFEKKYYFEGCLPIEEIAKRGRESLAFGPLKPVGITDPKTGVRPHAVVQLRKETKEGVSYGMVGFQTKLKYHEQESVFKTIPGMSNAEFLRLGSLHRNTYINSPAHLKSDLSLQDHPNIRFAGQITGVEGYVEAIATGFLAGIFAAGDAVDSPVDPPPPSTAIGALLSYITGEDRADNFQPTNINFSLFPPLDLKIKNRKERRRAIMDRAEADFSKWASDELGA